MVYINVKRSKFHNITSHPPIFPCTETIEWILQNTDTDSWMIRGHAGASIAAISSANIVAYYRLPERQEVLNARWLSEFVIPVKDILREWWQDPSKFWVRTYQAYKIEGLRKVYQLIATMMCRLYGKADCDVFYCT